MTGSYPEFKLQQSHPWLISAIMIMVAPLSGISVDIYTPSMPVLVNYFHTTPALVKLSIALYLLGYGIGQLLIGPISDSIGRKPLLLLCLLLFCGASIGAGLAENIHQLLLFRLCQGLSVAGPGLLYKAMITDCFTGMRLARITTTCFTVWSLSPVVAPFIGGYIQHYTSWHYCFYVLAVYALVAFLVVLFALPEPNQAKHPLHPKIILSNYWEIITTRVFMCGVLIVVTMGAVVYLFNTLGPFLIQDVLGRSALSYAHIALVMGLGIFLGNVINRFLINRYSSLTLIGVGLALMLLTSIGMLVFASDINLLAITLPVFGLLLLQSIVATNNAIRCLRMFPHKSGTANAVLGSGLMIGSALISSAASFITLNNQMPLAIIYVGVMCFSLLLYLLVLRGKHGGQH